jgi:hypothetical protein
MTAAKAVELTTMTLYAPPRPPRKEQHVIRAIVQFESEPDPDRYRRHLDEFVPKVEYSAFRHGKVIGSPFGEPTYGYHAEFEWADEDAFKAAVNSEAFAATGKDAMEMGVPFTVNFVSLS